MSDPQDVSSVMEVAAQAAGAGDFVSAERELRRGLALQEAALGPAHPDLANTLNNLGVVAERLNKPADAEGWYRRAYAIASGVLQPDHPFVVMSAKNLRDFCDARGIPFERSAPVAPPLPADSQPRASWPPPRKAEAAPVAPVGAAPPPAAPRPVADRPPAQPKRDPVPAPAATLPAEPSTSPRFLVIAAIVLAALIVGGIWTMWSSRTAREEAAATSPSASSQPAATRADPALAQPAATPPPATPAPEPASPAPHPAAPVEPQQTEPSAPATPPKQVRHAATGAGPAATLVSAQLCRPLTIRGSWNCTPASDRVAAGVVFYYTKVTCPADTTIEHRWYFNDRLLQSVALRVRANSSGYRTYSRTTIGPERAGNWRVELLTADGTVLHEARFSVTR
jgi:hypothetical protein